MEGRKNLRVLIFFVILFLGLTEWVKGEEQTWFEKLIQRFSQGSVNEDEDYRQGYQFYLKKDYDRAISYLKRSVEKNPDGEENHLYLFNSAYESKRLNEMVKFYEGLLKHQPEHLKLNHRLALIYMELNEWEKAETSLLKIISSSPQNLEPYYSLYIVYNRLGKTSEAEELYEKAKTLGKDSLDFHLNLGKHLRNNKLFDLAIKEYEIVLQKDPGRVRAQIELGHFYSKQERYDKVLETFSAILKQVNYRNLLTREKSYVHTYIGKAYYKMEMLDESINALKEAIRIDPNFIWPHQVLVNVYHKMKRYNDARGEVEECLKINPEDSWAKERLVVFERLGTTSEASKAFKISVREKGLNFTLLNLEGNPVEFNPSREKVTILGFYSVWCGVSIGPVAKLKEIKEEFKGKDIQIVSAIFLHGSAKPLVKPFVQSYKLDFPVLIGESGFMEMAFDELETVKKGNQETISFLRNVRGLEEACHGVGMMPLKPLILIIDKQGIIRFIHQDYPDMDILKQEIGRLTSERLQKGEQNG